MAIEELYPYAIMGYSAFVTILAVYLWKLTNLNVDGTRHNIEKQVATAVVDIGAKVDAKLEAFEMPDMAPLMAKIDGIEESIPDFDGETIMAKLEAFEQSIPDTISTHIDMHLKAAKATDAKQMKAALEEMGINFDAAADEAQAFVEAQLPPEMAMMKKLLTAKIPKGVKDDHPGFAWFLDETRKAGGQYMLGRMQDRLQGGVTIESAGGSGSFRPGFRGGSR